MSTARLVVIAAVVAALAAAIVVDNGDRPVDRVAESDPISVPRTVEGGGVWFCPGGSPAGGLAGVALELVNAGSMPATAIVTGVRSGSGAEPLSVEEFLEPGERRPVPLAELVTDSPWMGAVVEVDASDVVVEQTYVGATAGADRAPCHTQTATRWVAAAGATRVTEFGEQMTLLVLNPFLDDAVLDISFDSDVGVDSLPGVVVPAQRVIAIDVTEEVTVASQVSAVIDVIAGRVVVNRIQVTDNADVAGLTVTPASGSTAATWYLPTVHRGERNDRVSVLNPSATEEAEVDLEIRSAGEEQLDPIELTVRPGRTVTVDLADEARLEGVTEMALIARSLSGVPVAVMLESDLPFGDGPVSNTSATTGADVASTRWLAPADAAGGGLAIYNPSTATIATVRVFVAEGEEPQLVAEIEVGPERRALVEAEALGGERPIVVVEATAPVVVGRELADVSLHAMLNAVATGPVDATP